MAADQNPEQARGHRRPLLILTEDEYLEAEALRRKIREARGLSAEERGEIEDALLDILFGTGDGR